MKKHVLSSKPKNRSKINRAKKTKTSKFKKAMRKTPKLQCAETAQTPYYISRGKISPSFLAASQDLESCNTQR